MINKIFFSSIQPHQKKIKIFSKLSLILLCLNIIKPCWADSISTFPSSTSPLLISQNSNISMTGGNGNYEIRLLVNSSPEKAWKIITNYTNVNNFMPDVVSSKIVENNGNQKILDQVYQSTYTLGIKAKVRVQVKESYPKEININLIRGDFLNKFQGNLSLKPAGSKQLKLTQKFLFLKIYSLIFIKSVYWKG